MAFTIYTLTGDGVTDTFAVNFPLGYLNKSDVQVQVNNEVDGLGDPVYRTLTWITDGMVKLSGAIPAMGVPIKFTRTVTKTALIHDYTNGAIIEESNLDDSNKQSVMLIQELLDGRFSEGFAAEIDMNGFRIINMGEGTDADDAVTLTQLQDMTGNAPFYAAQAAASAIVASAAEAAAELAQSIAEDAAADALAQAAIATAAAAGIKWRPSVRLSTTSNDTLSGLAARDGVTPIAGNRVLVLNQSSPAFNGIYIAASGAWTRATDADTWNELVAQAVIVEEGTVNGDKVFICTVNSGGTLNTTPITYTALITPAPTYAANTIVVNATGSTATATGLALINSQLAGRGSSGNVSAINLGSGLVMSGTTLISSFGGALLHLQDQKSAGTSGGTATAGSWQKRDLAAVTNEIGSVITASEFTLGVGTYWVDGSAPATRCGEHKARLYNVTDSVVSIEGTAEVGSTSFASSARSLIAGRVVVTGGTKTFRLEHRVASTQTTNGYGGATNLGGLEVYSDLKIWKLV